MDLLTCILLYSSSYKNMQGTPSMSAVEMLLRLLLKHDLSLGFALLFYFHI